LVANYWPTGGKAQDSFGSGGHGSRYGSVFAPYASTGLWLHAGPMHFTIYLGWVAQKSIFTIGIKIYLGVKIYIGVKSMDHN
jgi:hypothetical protein